MRLTLATESLPLQGGPFEVPPVGELFNFPAIFDLPGEAFDINRVVLITLTASLISIIFFVVAFSNAKVVPGKLQSAAESIVEFVRDQVAIDIMGPKGVTFVPLLLTLFMFVWINNLFEIIPFVNFPSTSKIALPLFLAVIVWITYIVTGVVTQGPKYFLEVAFPPGVPKALYLLLTPIELLSTFILRPVTLTVRLFANMVAGHILLTIVFLATNAFLYLGPGLPLGLITLLLSPVAVGFELFIGLLQAYIFIILTSVYLAGALEPEH